MFFIICHQQEGQQKQKAMTQFCLQEYINFIYFISITFKMYVIQVVDYKSKSFSAHRPSGIFFQN